ncbi:MAG TPA: hypothetical protein VIP70_09105 [Nitrososphaeraceae archaeon]
MTMPKGWKSPADKARREAEDKARREAEERARAIVREAEERAKQIVREEEEKGKVEAKERARVIVEERERRAKREAEEKAKFIGMPLLQYSMLAWIDMYKEFAINAGKMSEYWFNLFWSPSTKEQRKDKVKVE